MGSGRPAERGQGATPADSSRRCRVQGPGGGRLPETKRHHTPTHGSVISHTNLRICKLACGYGHDGRLRKRSARRGRAACGRRGLERRRPDGVSRGVGLAGAAGRHAGRKAARSLRGCTRRAALLRSARPAYRGERLRQSAGGCARRPPAVGREGSAAQGRAGRGGAGGPRRGRR